MDKFIPTFPSFTDMNIQQTISERKEFSDKKEEFYKVIKDFKLLSEKEKTNMIRYLDSFYAGFDKRNSIVSNLVNECKSY